MNRQPHYDTHPQMIVCDYVQIKIGEPLPAIGTQRPFMAVVCVETPDVSEQWRSDVSAWLVESGCLYAMAWGPSASIWDDAIDEANLVAFDYAEIPDDNFVMTTWHEEELPNVFWFAKNAAKHPTVELNRGLLIHISESNRETELLRLWNETSDA